MATKSSAVYPFSLRIPDELKTQLDVASDENRRPLTAEILLRLTDSFKPPLRAYSDADLVAELMRRYGRGEIYIRIGAPLAEDKDT